MNGLEARGFEDVGIVELRIYLKFEMKKGREFFESKIV
jgi:hypothetical protein